MGLRIFIGSDKMTPEDASSYGEHHAFVFDGLGGAGGKVRTTDDGWQASEARVASMAAAEALDTLLEERWAQWADGLDFSSQTGLEGQIRSIVEEEIGGAMLAALKAAAKKWNAVEGGKFPTTIAGWLTFPAPGGGTLAVAVWAGDSRCYTMDADSMKLYSQDDAAEKYRRDAMEDCIYKDSLPMNNRLGLDLAFTLHYNCHIFEGPILLLSCSDGFYHCGESPMHFEYYLRNLGEEESIEAMQREWTNFVLEDNRFEDDSASLETIFIHTDPDDVEALRVMLRGRMDKLKQDYIDKFQEEGGRKGYSDVDASINTMVKRLCAEGTRYHFLEELRANAIRLAKGNSEIPSDMPCAPVVRQMRSEYLNQTREWNIQRDSLAEQKTQAEKNLDNRIRAVRIWEPIVSWEPPKLSRPVDALIKRPDRSFMDRGSELQDRMHWWACEIHWYMLFLDFGNSQMRSWMELSREADRYYQNQRTYRQYRPLYLPNSVFPCSKAEAFREIQQRLIDQCALVDKQAELSQIVDRLTEIRTGAPKASSRDEELTSGELEQLKKALIQAADGAGLDNSTVLSQLRHIRLSASDLMELFVLAVKYVRVRREFEDFDRNREVLLEPSAQPFDEYLECNRHSDAQYLINRWLELGECPDCFHLPDELHKVFQKNVAMLQSMKANNEAIWKQDKERRNRWLGLWGKYKPDFEAHDEPFDFMPTPVMEPEFMSIKFPVVDGNTGADIVDDTGITPQDNQPHMQTDGEAEGPAAILEQEPEPKSEPEQPVQEEVAPDIGPASGEGT